MTTTAQQYNKKQKIRKKIRSIRQSLTPQTQHKEAQKITNYITNHNRIKQVKHIGLFISVDNEINTNYLITKLLHIKKKYTYL